MKINNLGERYSAKVALPNYAQPVRVWTYDEVFKESDLVVIAPKAIANRGRWAVAGSLPIA